MTYHLASPSGYAVTTLRRTILARNGQLFHRIRSERSDGPEQRARSGARRNLPSAVSATPDPGHRTFFATGDPVSANSKSKTQYRNTSRAALLLFLRVTVSFLVFVGFAHRTPPPHLIRLDSTPQTFVFLRPNGPRF
jgi:hypothetical protein